MVANDTLQNYRCFHPRVVARQKNVLIGRKLDMLGNQTFEVPQPLKRTAYTKPFTYFTYSSCNRHLNHPISEILGQKNTWFEVSP